MTRSLRQVTALALLAAVGCGGAVETEQDQSNLESSEVKEHHRKEHHRKHQRGKKKHRPHEECDSGAPAPAIQVSAVLEMTSCDRSLSYEVIDVQTPAGEPISYLDYECLWTFDDGETSTACAGKHAWAVAGEHTATVRVRQRSTGGVGEDTPRPTRVFDPLQVVVEARAPDCGLSFEYVATRVGGRDLGFLGGSVTPWETVLTPGPYPASGAIEVSAPGTYLVTFMAEDEHPVGPICSATGSAEVTVRACPPPDDCGEDAGADGSPP
ncbi:MAG TPA: hypothetical protein VI072_09855 [Polyangiaceae bacterium]